MKAFLLAAGLGTRLRPLTDETPKCMLPVGGTPLLGIWLDALAQAGVDEVLVNAHHLPHIVLSYAVVHADKKILIRTAQEPELLGSAGTIIANRDYIEDEEFFLVCYADGLTNFPLANLINSHHEHAPIATIVTNRVDNPRAAGILEVDENGIMTSFTEKPEHPYSNLANAGIYAFSPAVLDKIPVGSGPLDIGLDLLPRLIGRARVLPITGYYRDIGNPESYQKALEEWATLR